MAQSMDSLFLATAKRLLITQTEGGEERGAEGPPLMPASLPITQGPRSVSPLSQCCRGLINIADLPLSNMTILNGSFTVDFTPFLNQFALQNTILPSRKKKEMGVQAHLWES